MTSPEHPASEPAADYQGSDFYCDVALAHPENLQVVLETDRVLAFHHTRPFWEVHVVVVPKRHIPSLTSLDLADPEDDLDARALLAAVQQVADDLEQEHGAAAVLTNLGAYQDSRHLHFHVAFGNQRADA